MEILNYESRVNGKIQAFNVKGIPIAPGYPYKHVSVADIGSAYLISISGALGANSEAKIVDEQVYGQTKQAILNIKNALAAALDYLGIKPENGNVLQYITSTRADLLDLGAVGELNKAYVDYGMPYSPRTTVEVSKLPLGGAVEITACAVVSKSDSNN